MRTQVAAILLAGLVLAGSLQAQGDPDRLQEQLESLATIERKILVPMRDGVGLATDVYRPRHAEGRLPAIFWRTPYNFNKLSSHRRRTILQALERGYAFVIQNERGRYFSQGEWEILGRPRTDGYDALTWIAEQDWSNGKVGTLGCSSSAEWQLALAATDHPAHAAMVPMAAGAGIGRVGRFYEQGNWYRGGAFQMLFMTWLYGVQNTQRPRLPDGLSNEDLVRLARYYDLAPDMPEVEWPEALEHLPLVDLMESVQGPKGIYADFIQRAPDDPAWYQGGLYHDDEPFGVPSLWLNSWYDVSIGPNLELFNHVTRAATDPEVADNQFVVIAPTPHCRFADTEGDVIVGERNLGEAGRDYDSLIFDWFDHWLKGEQNGFTRDHAKVQYFTMGSNRWQSSNSWPPESARPVTWYLDSDGAANSLYGDGRLIPRPGEPPGSRPGFDSFSYDPALPVYSRGGGVCCIGGAITPGSFDQRLTEARNDVLVYTSEPLQEDVEVTGTIEVTLFISSDARDTDFTVKLVDVYPDGRAYNVDETIQRARYREGYDRQVLLEPGEVYRLEVSPMSTSNCFLAGHRIRVEISSSNFPRFARNLNTGGNNFDETEGVVARNVIHHSPEHPSQIRLPVVIPERQEQKERRERAR